MVTPHVPLIMFCALLFPSRAWLSWAWLTLVSLVTTHLLCLSNQLTCSSLSLLLVVPRLLGGETVWFSAATLSRNFLCVSPGFLAVFEMAFGIRDSLRMSHSQLRPPIRDPSCYFVVQHNNIVLPYQQGDSLLCN